MVDVELFGGGRAYLRHVCVRALYAVGAYRAVDRIDWDSISRLVFICHGNICRSPYACVRARGFGIDSVSFGLAAADGAVADECASRNALRRGVNLTLHRSARLRPKLLEKGDLVVVFEPQQLIEVRLLGATNLAGVTLMGVWDRPVYPHIHDPFGSSDRYFQRCFSTIDRNLDQIAARIVAHNAPAGQSGALVRVNGASLPPSLSGGKFIP